VRGAHEVAPSLLAGDGALGRARGGRGVLVKRMKPGQDLRVDLPAIGPETVTRAAESGLAGIAVEAGRVLVAGRAETVRRADAAGLFLIGRAFDDGKDAA